MVIKDDQLDFRCFEFKTKKEKKKFKRDLIKRFTSTYEFCAKGITEFILLLRKQVYP